MHNLIIMYLDQPDIININYFTVYALKSRSKEKLEV